MQFLLKLTRNQANWRKHMFFASINLRAAFGQWGRYLKETMLTVIIWILTVVIFCITLVIFITVFIMLNAWLNSKGYGLPDVFLYGNP